MSRVVILYEDSRAAGGPGKEFPFHKLLLSRVSDQTGADLRSLHSCFQAVPKNGVNNVLKALREDWEDLAPGGAVLAVVDSDRLHQHVKGLSSGASQEEAEEAVLKDHPSRENVRLLLIIRNIEAVVNAVASCDPGTPPTTLQRALQKSRLDRDQVLQRATPQGARSVRDCMEKQLPSLKTITNALKESYQTFCAGEIS